MKMNENLNPNKGAMVTKKSGHADTTPSESSAAAQGISVASTCNAQQKDSQNMKNIAGSNGTLVDRSNANNIKENTKETFEKYSKTNNKVGILVKSKRTSKTSKGVPFKDEEEEVNNENKKKEKTEIKPTINTYPDTSLIENESAATTEVNLINWNWLQEGVEVGQALPNMIPKDEYIVRLMKVKEFLALQTAKDLLYNVMSKDMEDPSSLRKYIESIMDSIVWNYSLKIGADWITCGKICIEKDEKEINVEAITTFLSNMIYSCHRIVLKSEDFQRIRDFITNPTTAASRALSIIHIMHFLEAKFTAALCKDDCAEDKNLVGMDLVNPMNKDGIPSAVVKLRKEVLFALYVDETILSRITDNSVGSTKIEEEQQKWDLLKTSKDVFMLKMKTSKDVFLWIMKTSKDVFLWIMKFFLFVIIQILRMLKLN